MTGSASEQLFSWNIYYKQAHCEKKSRTAVASYQYICSIVNELGAIGMKQIYFTNVKDPSLLRRSRKAVTKFITSLAMELFPSTTARLAEKMLCVPSPPRRKLLDLDFLVGDIDVYGHKIKIYKTGNFDRSVIFVHGWSGSSADFNEFYKPLLDRGYNIITFDQVAHGASHGKAANMFLFVRAIEQMLESHRDQTRVSAIVAHSMGGSALINALKLEQSTIPVVLIAPLIPFFESLYQSVDNFGISTQWVDALLNVFEERYGRSVDVVDPKITIQCFVNPLITIQDRNDQYIALETNTHYFTSHVAASLYETEGLGHFRILGDQRVISKAVEFIDGVSK